MEAVEVRYAAATSFRSRREYSTIMGVTISYRGRLAEPTRIEDFEDRLVDFALEIGGLARIWRSWADDDPDRMVRGIILDLAPGQESTSLLVSPEGWLIGLIDIEDAEDGRLKEPPWCFTKTQFGPVEGHVAIVEMLAALKRRFLPDLEVSDDGGYWETRDLAALVRNRRTDTRQRSTVWRRGSGVMDSVARRRKIRTFCFATSSGSRSTSTASWAAPRNIRHSRLRITTTSASRQTRKPRKSSGTKYPSKTTASRNECSARSKNGGAVVSMLKQRSATHCGRSSRTASMRKPNNPESRGATTSLAPFGESFDDADAAEGAGFRDARDDWFESEEQERHPLLQQAMDLLVRFDTLFRDADPRFAPSLSTLYRGAGDAMGGLAQALSPHDLDGDDYGLCIVQLKRALRGAAFARGALFPLRSILSEEQFDELFRVLQQMETDIVSEMGKVRLM